MTERTIAVYARVSTTEQSCEAQLRALREFCDRRGFRIFQEYTDQVSGKAGRAAPGYRALMADAYKCRFNTVLVWRYDRLARSMAGLIEALINFAALKIDFISLTEAIDTTTAMGRLFYSIVGSFAEFERELIGERVKAGLMNARAKGVQLGRPRFDGEETVRRLWGEGISMRKIARITGRSPAGVRLVLRRAERNIP